MVSSPNANLLLGHGLFSPLTKFGRGERNTDVGAFSLLSAGVPSEDPSVQAQHAWDWPPEQASGCPPAAPPATPEDRWDPGPWAADKARKLLLVRHFRAGHDFHNNKRI